MAMLPAQMPLLEPTHQVVVAVISTVFGILLYMPMAVNWALELATAGLMLTD